MTPLCFFIATTWSTSPNPSHFPALARELVARGHRAVLLLDRQRTDIEDHSAEPAIYSWPSPRPTHWRDARFLQRLIARYRPDCLIANFGAGNVMTLVGWLARVPCRVVWYRTLTSQIELDSAMPLWQRKLLRLRKRPVYALATHIVANSQATREDVERMFGVNPKKCRVFDNSLADPLTLPEVREAVSDRTRRIICTGRLYPAKGQDVLINATAMLKDEISDVQVEFLGDGPQRDHYVALARELGVERECSFVGSVPHAEVLRRMASAVATVVPSRSEAFGVVNIESLAVCTPVVASRVGGISDIVRDGIDGFLVDPDDPHAIASRLRQLLEEPGLTHRMGEQARARFLDRFEQGRVVRAQADWFEGIAWAGRWRRST